MKDVRLDWMERFAALEQCMREAGDEQNSDRMRDLMRKAARKEWIVAFCGHFSAGKSTMLNQLFGQRILPTSPIPTSANVVRIQKGEDRVKLVFMTGRSVIIPGKADDQDLKSWCKNGEEVREVHVFRSDAPLPAQVVLMDTPGIDSTDEAHHQMTEAALHLADVIFYVMDYNHVQSEINLRFVKKLAERGKRVVLVVNQIDKHQEQELPFDVYQRNVESSFGEWGIPVEKIYYTSLAQPDFPGNQWGDLKEGMKALMQERKHGMRQSWETEANHLVKSHLSFMNGKWEPLLQACQEKMREVSENEGENLDERKERLQAELDRLQRSDRPEAAMLQGLEDILKNAYLMPFELRELARLYLETVLTPFKVGFLFSKSKTEQEKKRREEAFLEKLREVVQAQCGVHVKDYLLRFAKESGLPAHWEERIYSHSLKLTAEFLRRVIKPGAAFTDAYLLTYTDDLAEEIKRGYRSWALGLADEWKDDWRKSAEERGKRLKQELKRLHQQEEAKKEWERIQQERREWQQRLADCLSGKNRLPIEWGTWLADEGEWVRDRSEWEKWFHSVTTVEPSESETEPVPLAEGPVLPSHGSPDEALERIRRAIGIMEPVDALAAIREELIEKLRRAEEKRFTVALFGAFSAGKSSLANALIGKKVFAVSPHPTTATIQKIVPPTESLPHGQGIIRFKTKERLHEELKNALRLFERKAETWEEAVKALPEALQSEIHHPRQKLARPFLEAVHHGLRQFQGCLGTQEVADFAVCRSYSAEEGKSCFVDSIEWSVDCSFTRQGMTIVDTPGADSIHSRHTEVAFQYIRSADAILYVTYYNHPFSKADREFLLQLGRVKEAFARDKMFFVVNAADLAGSSEELREVERYVKEQLLHHGIRHPRLYSLSSLLGLKEKENPSELTGKSGFQIFEQDFTRFVLEDLSRVAHAQMAADIERGIRWLESLIEAAEANQEEQARKQVEARKNRETIGEKVRAYRAEVEEKALEQEIHELIYYVKQRVFLRYRDAFVEIFNPSVLRDDGGDIKRKLDGCAGELVDFLKLDLMQEMKATALRVEKWLSEKQEHVAKRLAEQAAQVDPQLILPIRAETEWKLPAWEEPFREVPRPALKKVLSLYKNAKQFFERNEREKMREEMLRLLEPMADVFIQQEKERFVQHYRTEWRNAVASAKELALEETERYYDSVLQAVEASMDAEEAKNAVRRLREEYDGLAVPLGLASEEPQPV